MNKMLLPVRSSCRTLTTVANDLDHKDLQRPFDSTVHPDSAPKGLELRTNHLPARAIA